MEKKIVEQCSNCEHFLRDTDTAGRCYNNYIDDEYYVGYMEVSELFDCSLWEKNDELDYS